MKYFRGCKPDPRDRRDYRKAAPRDYVPPDMAIVPGFQNLHITDQGSNNSCTGNAVALWWQQVLESRGEHIGPLSWLYPWFYARAAEGVREKNEGVSLRSIMQAVQEFGIPPLEYWSGQPIKKSPSQDALKYGRAIRLPDYERCDTLLDIQYSIAHEGQAVILGTTIFADWMDGETARTGVVTYDPMTPVLDGHALVILAFDNRKQRFWGPNSWGTGWGDNGYFSLPYDFVTRERFDCWTAGYTALPDKSK